MILHVGKNRVKESSGEGRPVPPPFQERDEPPRQNRMHAPPPEKENQVAVLRPAACVQHGNLLEAMLHNAVRCPAETAFSWLKDDCSIENSFTWREVWHFSQRVCEKLVQQHKLQRGDRVMIVYPFGLDFIIAFLACLRVGVVVVSVYPPNPARLAKDIPKFQHFVEDSGATFALTTSKYAVMVRYSGLMHKWPKDLKWVSTDDYSRKNLSAPCWSTLDVKSDDEALAFIQYTSGSTGNPKGVMITFGNLQHQLNCLSSFPRDYGVYVGWVPQYHDMGLFNILCAVYTKTPSFLMSPLQFIHNPLLWPRAIEKFKATWIAAPNFAYALTCKRLQEHGLRFDCSSLSFAGFGAEPTLPSTLQSAVSVMGVPWRALVNMYGLAEICLLAVGWCSEAGPLIVDDRAAVGSLSWSTALGIDIVVASPADGEPDHDMAPVGEGQVGEICLKSASVAAGYWGQEQLTHSTFRARIAGHAGSFLRTGDLGYAEGDALFMTCRLKDLIIVSGRNVWPSDLEIAGEQSFSKELRPGCSAAFQGSDAGAVLVCEVREAGGDLEELAERVRREVEGECGVLVEQVVLVARGSVPKTTSGKVERGTTAQRLRDGKLKTMAQSGAGDGDALHGARSLEAILEACGVVDLDKSVVENGISSLQVMQMVNVAKRNLGIDIDYQSVSDLSAAELVRAYGQNGGAGGVAAAPPTIRTQDPPLNIAPPPPRVVCVLWQALILAVQAAAIVLAALPVVAVVERWFDPADSRWMARGRAGIFLPLVIVLWMVAYTLLCVLIKWMVLGKMRAGHLRMWGPAFARWMLVERLFSLWEFACGRFLLETPWLNLVYRLLGADVCFSARLDSFFRCWDLVSVGHGAKVSGLLYPRVFDRHGVRFAPIRVEAAVTVGSRALVQAPARISEGVTLEPHSVVPPHSILAPEGSRWHGNLCRLRSSPPPPAPWRQPCCSPSPACLSSSVVVQRPKPRPLTSTRAKVCDLSSDSGSFLCQAQSAAETQAATAEEDADSATAGSGGVAADADAPQAASAGLASEQTEQAAMPAPLVGEDSSGGEQTRPSEVPEGASEPLWVTRAAFPLLFLGCSVAAYAAASHLLPVVDPAAPAWSWAAMGAAASYVGAFLLSGVVLALGVVLPLKWSFFSPFTTDAMAAATMSTFLPMVDRSPLLVGAWLRLLGTRLQSGALVLFTWSVPASQAHLVSLGPRSVLFSTLFSPRAPASLLAYLRGRCAFPWTEPIDIEVEEGCGCYGQSGVLQGARLGRGAQVAAFGCVEARSSVAPGAVMSGAPCIQVGSKPLAPAAAPGKHAAPVSEHDLAADESSFRGVGWTGQVCSLLLLTMHVSYVAGIMVVGVQIEKSLPAAAAYNDSGEGIARYLAVVVRVLGLVSWVVGGLMVEVVCYKKLVLGRASVREVPLHSWRALAILNGCGIWERAAEVLVGLFGGGFAYDAVLWMLGYDIAVGSGVNLSVCFPLQDAELMVVEPGVVLDELAYVSCHNTTTTGFAHGRTRVCRGAVLHPYAGLSLSTCGENATLYPRSKTIRELHIEPGSSWAGAPAKQAVCKRCDDLDNLDRV